MSLFKTFGVRPDLRH